MTVWVAIASVGVGVAAAFTTVSAEWDTSAPGIVVGVGCLALPSEPNGGVFYGHSGEAWVVGPGTPWQRKPEYDLPVSPSDIKFLDTDNAGTGSVNLLLVTNSDVVWGYVGLGPIGHWENFGSFPGGPFPTTSRSWGSVKGAHRDADSDR